MKTSSRGSACLGIFCIAIWYVSEVGNIHDTIVKESCSHIVYKSGTVRAQGFPCKWQVSVTTGAFEPNLLADDMDKHQP